MHAVRLAVFFLIAFVKACLDTNNVAADIRGYGCDHYTGIPSLCAEDYHDTSDFQAATMCCACGGGIPNTVIELEERTNGRYLAAASDTVLGGSIEMQVPHVTEFLGDQYAQYAVAQGIAEVANITVNYVDLSVHLFLEGVQANYTIAIPSTASVTPYSVSNKLDAVTLSQLSTSVQGKVRKVNGDNYTLIIASKSFVRTVSLPAITTTISPSYTFLSGKIWMLVPDAAAFKLDNYAQYAVALSVAEAAGVSVNYVQLSATKQRRLDVLPPSDFSIEVDYVIIIPSSSSITADDARGRLESTTIAQMHILVQQNLAKIKENSYVNATSVISKSPVTWWLSATTVTTTPFLSSLSGTLNLTVPDASAFLDDHYARYAVAHGIAAIAGLSASDVNLTARILNSRRLDSVPDLGRRLLGNVEISYVITIPHGESVNPLTVNNKLLSASLSDVTAAIQAEMSKVKDANYVVIVIGKSTHTVKPHQAPTISPDSSFLPTSGQSWNHASPRLEWLFALTLFSIYFGR